MTRLSMVFPLMFVLLAPVACAKKSSPQTSPPSPVNASGPSNPSQSLVEARKGFQTQLTRQHRANEPVPDPPPAEFQKVTYESPVGKLAAYITPDPKDGKKRPAIIWITGGDCNTIGDVWSAAGPEDDQTARQFRDAGIVMMFPSLRGGNNNPGVVEGFFGEVDDVVAAGEFLAKQPHVDPKRIYLGGHSTGGTLVLLVAESTDRFRAVFSFGPADEIRRYPAQFIPGVNTKNSREVELRSPARWLHSIKVPVFVFEGSVQGNLAALETMASSSTNPRVLFYPITGGDHFSILAPTNRLIAEKILKDTAADCNLAFTETDLNRPFGR